MHAMKTDDRIRIKSLSKKWDAIRGSSFDGLYEREASREKGLISFHAGSLKGRGSLLKDLKDF